MQHFDITWKYVKFSFTLTTISYFFFRTGCIGFLCEPRDKTGSESFYVWYLQVVELQGTSRGGERKGGPNPFGEKLCRGRLKESGVSARGVEGGACLWPPLKPVTLLVEYAQDDLPPSQRPKTHSSRWRQTATERLLVVSDPTSACKAKGGRGQHISLRKCVALELQATTNVCLVFSTCSFKAGKSHSNSKLHPRNDASGHTSAWFPIHRNLKAETVGAQPWPPAASVSTDWPSCDNSLQLTSACGGWVAYTNTRAGSDIPVQRQPLSEVFVDRGVLGDPSQAAQSSVGVLF